MNKLILIRIIVIVVVIPVIAEIVRRNIQKKRKKESQLVAKEVTYTKSNESEFKNSNKSTSLEKSEFIDSYNHPNYYTSSLDFLILFFWWILLLYGLSYFLLYLIFKASIIAVSSAIIINIIFILILRHSINVNKKKIVLNLFSDKLIFSKGLTQSFIEIPKNKILKLQLIAEKSTTIWPDEYILIEINSEYVKNIIEPILNADKSVEYSQLIKIKFLGEQVKHLKGRNNTLFKEQLFKFFNG
jgi:hypothetical protein